MRLLGINTRATGHWMPWAVIYCEAGAEPETEPQIEPEPEVGGGKAPGMAVRLES